MSPARGASNDNGRRRFVVRYALLYTAFMMFWQVVISLVLIRLGEVSSSTERTIGLFIGQALAMFALGWWLARWQWQQRQRKHNAGCDTSLPEGREQD